ncbi:MAG: hypothetical protein RJA46_1224, partial [Pseudomonadota bacterium]
LRKSSIAFRASSSAKSAQALLEVLKKRAVALKQNARESVCLKECVRARISW